MTDLCLINIFFVFMFAVVNSLSTATVKILFFFVIAICISFNKLRDVQLSSIYLNFYYF